MKNQEKGYNDISDTKALSKFWTPQEWEDYLLQLEVAQSESTISPQHLDSIPIIGDVFELPDNDKESGRVEIPGVAPLLVRRAIQELSQRQAQIIIEIFWNDLTEQQVAQKLGLSKNSVKVHKRRALEHLRAALAHKDSKQVEKK